MATITSIEGKCEEECTLWSENICRSLNNENCNIILIYHNDYLIGFFMYSVINSIQFNMEEIQIIDEYKSKYNVFRKLYKFTISLLSEKIEVVDAQGKKAPISKLADTVSGYFVPAVIIISIVSALLCMVLEVNI